MIALINPNLIALRNDPFTTGIVYMPVSLAYVAAGLRAAEIPIEAIDAYALNPFKARRRDQFLVVGLSPEELLERIPTQARAAFVYAINLTNHNATMEIVRALKQARPDLPVVILENTQAVTAYALKHVAEEFYAIGADYVLCGEGDHRAVRLARLLLDDAPAAEFRTIDGLGSPDFFTPPDGFIADLDDLPFPAWDLFPLENYWKLRYAHGPQTTDKYLPLLTSRGCPYPCEFCVVPETNRQRWRPRSATNVVDEMEHFSRKYSLREFHIEDLDPTISDERIREMCNQIIDRRLDVIWKIAAGTKVETMRSEETIDLMARAGCRYISISPETGSPRLLKQMRKPFKLDHAVRLVKRMNQVGICSQTCFVLGFPGETDEDRRMTWDLVRDLTRHGVDEIALFIITPVPGSGIYSHYSGYQSLSQLNFTPTWRDDYDDLARFRLQLYRSFLLWKLRYQFTKMVRQPFKFLARRFDTKMEMVPYRAIKLKWLDLRSTRS
jgi:anaerobic magnesium-protoporphyrin IX monomethyl ester cyclase